MTMLPVLPFSEWTPDTSDFNGITSAFLANVLPRGDGYGPMPGFSTYSLAIAGDFNNDFSGDFSGGGTVSSVFACRGFFKAIKTDGSISIFAASATRIYQMSNSTQTWTDVSKSGAPYTALSSTDQWQFVQYINFVIAVQANVAPQYFDLTSSTTFDNLAGSPPQSRYISVVGQFVVLSGLVTNPYRVQWSALGDPTGWTAGVSSSSFQDLGDGGIVRGVAGGEYGNIFQDSAIRRLVYAPGSPVIFQIQRISEDRGLYAPYSLVRSGDMIFFLGPQGWMQMSPSGYPQPIGKEKVNRTFFADLDRGNLQMVLGASDPQNNRVFFAYKSNNGVAGQFDKMLCYDYVLNRFTPIAFRGEFIGSLSQPGVTLENLDNISSSIDALIPSLDSFANSSAPEIAAFDTNHKLGFFRGDNLEATVETAAQELQPGRRMFIAGIRPITDAPVVYGSIGSRERLDSTETFTAEQVSDANGFIPQRASTRLARGRLRIPAATAWSFVSGLEPDARLEGGR